MDFRGPLQGIHDNIVVKTERDESLLKTPKPLSGDDQSTYRRLLSEGKAAAHEGNLDESLAAFKKAYNMNPTEKILGRIKRIEEAIEEMEPEENDDFVQLDNGLIIFREMVEKLYPHQIDGVKWIYDLQKKRKRGGILADDMGLGKTIQVISALSAMFDMEEIRSVLLVLPLSLIPNWQREFESWAPGIKVRLFYGSVREREKALVYCQRKPSVCITTYGLVQTKWEQLSQDHYRKDFTWDYIILDEGHKIKNPTKTTKGLHAISSRNRLILTGTPIQNNLRELWALFDWVMQGTLLGTQKTFKMEYETPITRARQRGASAGEIHLGNFMAESLRKIVDPYILRRTKGSVSKVKPGPPQVDKNQQKIGLTQQPSFPELKKKNDFVIWTFLSSVQEEIYKDFLEQDSVKELLASKRSPLVYLTILKKICDHPRLLPRRACHQLGLEANESLREEDFHSDVGKECAANRIDNISDETLIEESGKLQFLLQLLQRLKEEGHRTLIFSQSRKMLNIVHRILINRQFKVMRLDGTISKLGDRELRVKKFQQDSSYDVFLLTTQVGGVGLTLTAADRVVIFDPSWNPATDAQAVDRIYRIGQDKNVAVYRLITCGTVEEKIYRRQIFKDSIIKQSTGDNKDPYRYFTNQELKELFILDDTRESLTQQQLNELHSGQRCLDPKLDEHLAYLHSLSMYGVSDHDLMFTQDPDDVDEDAEQHKDVIATKVAEARNRVAMEAQGFTGTEEAEARWGGFVEKGKSEKTTQRKENEPVYAIEGLYDKMEGLKVEDDMTRIAFNRNEDLVSSEDGDDHFAGGTPGVQGGIENGLDHAILVEDSPVQSDEDEKASSSNVIEIEESFVISDSEPGEDTRIISGGGGVEAEDCANVELVLSDRESIEGDGTGNYLQARHEAEDKSLSRRRSVVGHTRTSGPQRSVSPSSNREAVTSINGLHPDTARGRHSLTPGKRSKRGTADSAGGRQRARSSSMPPGESDALPSPAVDGACNKRRSSMTPRKRYSLHPAGTIKQQRDSTDAISKGRRRSGVTRNSASSNFGGVSRKSDTSRNSLQVPNTKQKSRRRSGQTPIQLVDSDEEVSGITQQVASVPRQDSVASGRNNSENVDKNLDDASFGPFYISASSESSRASTPVETGSRPKKRDTLAESSTSSLLRSQAPSDDDSMGVDGDKGDIRRGENASKKKSIPGESSTSRPSSGSPALGNDDGLMNLDTAAGELARGNASRNKKSLNPSPTSKANSRSPALPDLDNVLDDLETELITSRTKKRSSTSPFAAAKSPANVEDRTKSQEMMSGNRAPGKSASRKRKSLDGSAASSVASSRSSTPLFEDDLPTNLSELSENPEFSDYPEETHPLDSVRDAVMSSVSSGFTPALKRAKSHTNCGSMDDDSSGGFSKMEEDVPTDDIARFSPQNEDATDNDKGRNRVGSEVTQTDKPSGLTLALSDEDSDSSDLEEESTQESQERPSSESDGEDIETDDHGRSQESDGSADMADFIVDDDDTMDAYASMLNGSKMLEEESSTADSPWHSRGAGRTKSGRRRSTALPQRRLIVESSDSEDEDDVTGYRAQDSDVSDDGGYAPTALRLTSESEDSD